MKRFIGKIYKVFVCQNVTNERFPLLSNNCHYYTLKCLHSTLKFNCSSKICDHFSTFKSRIAIISADDDLVHWRSSYSIHMRNLRNKLIMREFLLPNLIIFLSINPLTSLKLHRDNSFFSAVNECDMTRSHTFF